MTAFSSLLDEENAEVNEKYWQVHGEYIGNNFRYMYKHTNYEHNMYVGTHHTRHVICSIC